MAIRVAVVGAGTWGTTVAALASANAPTVLWSRRPELAASMQATRRNDTYLPGVVLPPPCRSPPTSSRPSRCRTWS